MPNKSLLPFVTAEKSALAIHFRILFAKSRVDCNKFVLTL